MQPGVAVVVPWHNQKQIYMWLEAWKVSKADTLYWLILQHDKNGEGCARTKNAGLMEAMRRSFNKVVVLDDDCYPADGMSLEEFADLHIEQLKPKPIGFLEITRPPSRGTPHKHREALMPVAASMGFWDGVGDVDAATDIVLGHTLECLNGFTVFTRYFPLCGMNLAFDLSWWPWCQFIDVPRYDDIWMGWLWQKRAYATGCCFSLDGPRVKHARQSDPWKNLVIEAPNMKANETLWEEIMLSPSIEYDELKKLLPL